MHDIFSKIGEAKIKDAIERGELKNLPGEGKPLILEPLNPFENPEDRMANKIMRNLGLIPQEVELKREVNNLKQRLAECHSKEERDYLKTRLQEVSIRYSVIMEKRRTR